MSNWNLRPLIIVPIVLMAISVSIMDFDNLSWDANAKSYTGLILVVLILLILMPFWLKSKKIELQNKKSLRKPNPLIIIPIVLLAISISIMNFDDLSWNANPKSYIGLILVVLILLALLPFWRKLKK